MSRGRCVGPGKIVVLFPAKIDPEYGSQELGKVTSLWVSWSKCLLHLLSQRPQLILTDKAVSVLRDRLRALAESGL